MSLTSTITYIKNGVEKTLVATKKNQRKIKKDIYKLTYKIDFLNYQIERTYIIKDDVEFIHFKNISFQESEKIKSFPNTICILENCSLGKINAHFNDFMLEGGIYEIINPILNKNNKGNTKIIFDNETNIIYTNSSLSKQTLELNNFIQNKQQIAKITAFTTIHQLIINFFNINLTNNLNLIRLSLKGNNITIGDSKEPTTIKISGSLPNEIIATEKLRLINCTIKSMNEEQLTLNSPQIEVKSTSLKAKDTIQLNNTYFHKKKDEPLLIIEDKDIARANLIACLKGYKQLLEEKIEVKKETYLQETYNKQQSLLEQQEIILQEQLLKLEQLRHQLKDEVTKKEQSLTKNLSKKPAKYFG